MEQSVAFLESMRQTYIDNLEEYKSSLESVNRDITLDQNIIAKAQKLLTDLRYLCHHSYKVVGDSLYCSKCGNHQRRNFGKRKRDE